MKNLYLIIGPSGSGKTTLEKNLRRAYNTKSVRSFTTRPPRRDGEEGHIFVTDKEFDNLGELAAFTEYNGYRYGVTKDILDTCDLYVIDPAGAFELATKYRDRKVCVIWLDIDRIRCAARMGMQGRAENDICDRIYYDEVAFSSYKLSSLVQIFGRNNVCILNANGSKDDVFMRAGMWINDKEAE